MSLQTQRIHETEYQYFYYYEKGKHKSISLGRKERPNVANIRKALSIIEEQRSKYNRLYERLMEMLPEDQREAG